MKRKQMGEKLATVGAKNVSHDNIDCDSMCYATFLEFSILYSILYFRFCNNLSQWLIWVVTLLDMETIVDSNISSFSDPLEKMIKAECSGETMAMFAPALRHPTQDHSHSKQQDRVDR